MASAGDKYVWKRALLEWLKGLSVDNLKSVEIGGDPVMLTGELRCELQDELETETSLSQWEWRQAFVFGNGNIAVKEFAIYEPGFRCQCEQEIKDYSAGEALIIAANLMGEAMRGHQAGSPHRGRHEKGGAVPEQQEHIFRMYALADGRLKNDQVFQAALSMLNDCQRQGMEFYLLMGEDSRCEACQKLDQLMQEGTYADPSHS